MDIVGLFLNGLTVEMCCYLLSLVGVGFFLKVCKVSRNDLLLQRKLYHY